MASPGGLEAPLIVITLRQGDAMGEKVAVTLLRTHLAYNYKYMDKKASTSSDSILFLQTSPQKVL